MLGTYSKKKLLEELSRLEIELSQFKVKIKVKVKE